MADSDLGKLFFEIGLRTSAFNSQLRANEAEITSRFGNIQALSGKLALASGIAFAGLSSAIGGVVKAASDFESSMNGVKAVSNASEGDLKRLSDLALQLGRDTAVSANDSARALEELVKGGVSVENIMSGAAKATVDLALAGKIDLASAATVAANALTLFGLSGKDLTRVVNDIAGVANATTVDVGDFALAMQQSGGVASQAGLSFDDLSKAIGVMAESGLRGSDAGTSLKTLLLNLTPTTENATRALKDLGIITKEGKNQFYDAHGSAKSFREIAELLKTSVVGLTDAEQTFLLKEAFGTDAVRAAFAMVKSGAAGVDDLSLKMEKVTAADVAAARMTGF